MTRFHMMLAVGALCFAASAAAAQQAPADQAAPAQSPTMGVPAQNQSGTGGQDMTAPAQNQGGAQPMAPSAAGAGVNTSVITAGDAPAAEVQALADGDNTLVTNGPIPDTPANRAKYGGPMSATGKHTRPAGN